MRRAKLRTIFNLIEVACVAAIAGSGEEYKAVKKSSRKRYTSVIRTLLRADYIDIYVSGGG